MGDNKFRAYLLNGKEHYTYTFDPMDSDLTAVRDDDLFPESLVLFAYLDRRFYEPIFEKIHSALSGLYERQTQSAADQVWECLNELGPVHIYFELLRVDWQARLIRSKQNAYQDAQELLPWEELSTLIDGIETRQQQIRDLFASELDMDVPQKKKPSLVILTETTKPIAGFHFGQLNFGFEQTKSGDYVQVLYPQDLFDLVDYHLRECLMQETRMRVCKNCGKYFAVVKNSKAEYCNHPFDAKGRSCREVASILQWNRNRADDAVFKEYRREYKKRFARMKAGTMDAAQFYLWSKLAREKKAECEDGKITLNEFFKWLSLS